MAEQIRAEEVKDTPRLTGGAKIFYAALYVRLSVEDGGKDNSNTVKNQLALLEEYISDKPYIKVYSVYVDNGRTGTDFNRPGFGRMMEDIKQGKINCIIVKDLSRFGRSYLETGNYIEKILPFFGVRLIAVTDQFDTMTADKTGEGLVYPLKNLINDLYAKDISRKVISVLETKKANGEHSGAAAPYGYVKSKEEKGRLAIDCHTAPVVRRIFEMRAEGYSYHAIARTLNAEDIPSPSAYRYRNGIVTNDRYKDVLWKRHVITDILKNRTYLGDIVRGKSKAAIYRGEARHPVGEKEWSIFTHRHEAIISRPLFDAANQVTEERKSGYMKQLGRYNYLGAQENYLKGRVFCGDCGCRLTLHKNVLRQKDVYYSYICANYEENKDSVCIRKSISKKELEEAVFMALRLHIKLFIDKKGIINDRNLISKIGKERKDIEAEMRNLQMKIAKSERLDSKLYIDYRTGLLTQQEYQATREKHRADSGSLQQRYAELQMEKVKCEEKYGGSTGLSCCLNQYKSEGRLTGEMADTFIEAVRVYADKRVEIQFRFQDEFGNMPAGNGKAETVF